MKSLFPLVLAGPAAAQVCIMVVTTTMPYQAALAAHTTGASINDGCPVNERAGVSYYSVDGQNACCSSNALARPPSESATGVGCCPCGAFCTGDLPKTMEWEMSGDALVIGDKTITPPIPSVSPTLSTSLTHSPSPTTPWHGPHTSGESYTDTTDNSSPTSSTRTGNSSDSSSPSSSTSSESTTGSETSGSSAPEATGNDTSGAAAAAGWGMPLGVKMSWFVPVAAGWSLLAVGLVFAVA